MRRRNEAGPDPDQSGTVVGVGESIAAHGYYPGVGERQNKNKPEGSPCS